MLTMTSVAVTYYTMIRQMMESIIETQGESIHNAAYIIAESLAKDQMCHVFGSGHSGMLAREIVHRAGGLVPVNQVPDPTSGMAERIEGYAEVIFQAYSDYYGIQSGEVIVIISNSGINPLPIELATLARSKGMSVIALTNLTQSRTAVSRHTSGKRLFELADVVLDNCCVPGDAMVYDERLGISLGPGSTLSGALLLNLMMLTAIDQLLRMGRKPPILKSQNLPGADEWNRELKARYRSRLVHSVI